MKLCVFVRTNDKVISLLNIVYILKIYSKFLFLAVIFHFCL